MTFGLSTRGCLDLRLDRSHLEAARRAGFAAMSVVAEPVHFDVSDERAAADLGRWLGELDLGLAAIHGAAALASPRGGRAATQVVERIIDVAAGLSCPTVIVSIGPDDIAAGRDGDAATARHNVERLVGHAAAYGVTVGLAVQSTPLARADALLDLIAELDDAPIGVALDVAAAHAAGGTAEAIEACAGRIVSVLARDSRGRTGEARLPFDGHVDWPSTLMELWKVGYDGPCLIDAPAPARGGWPNTVAAAVGVRTRLQAILDELAAPIVFEEDAGA